MTDRLGYRSALDGLRAVAVLAVLAYHLRTGFMPGGWIGVDVFFVLSGFLITRLLLDELAATSGVDLRAFYVRRARRLLPCLIAVLAVVTACNRGGLPVVAALTYMANLAAVHVDMGPLVHTWSLSIEEQFYLVWPVLLLWLVRRCSLRAIALTVAGAIAALVAWQSILYELGGPGRVFYGSDSRSVGILIGCLVALATMQGWRPRRTGPPACAGAVLLAAVALTTPEETAWLWHGGLAAVDLAAGAVLVHLLARPGMLAARPLVELGRRSYGLYLWHWPIFVLAPLPIGGCVVLSFAVTFASYRWVEQPFIRHRPARTLEPCLST